MTRKKLGECADVLISGVDKKTLPEEQPVRLCNYTDVYYNWAVTSEMYDGLMKASAKPNEIEKFKLAKGQVALTKDSETREDIGIPTYIASDFDDVILGYHCALIKPDKRQLDGKYLSALLHTGYVKEFFSNNAGGSGQRYYLSDANIKDLPLFLPDVAEQQKIGRFFSSIDRLIQLSRKRIENLEKLAKEIYDYWFVQFDFPDKNGKPYKSSGGKMVYNSQLKREIPEGWEVKCLSEVLKVSNGRDHKCLADGSYPVYGSGGVMRYADTAMYEDESVLIPRKGSLNNILYVRTPFWCVDTMFYTKPLIKHLPKYLYYSIRDFDFAGLNVGTGVPSMTAGIIGTLVICVPTTELLEAFDVKCEPIFATIENQKKAIAQLTQLRDFLLPFLMNGQAKMGGAAARPDLCVTQK